MTNDYCISFSRHNDFIDGGSGNDLIYGGERGEQGGDLLNIWIRDWGGTGVSVNFHTNEGGIATTTIGGGQSTLRFYQFENFFTHESNDTVSAANATPGAGNRGIISTRAGAMIF